ncbi:cytochrome P450 [Mycena rosella]|uniref:Cytochrome P450 n=1 Tax=Mycena rosella TaxID=1033263 RepID=A0AAD7G692_MYCRO|nr:cytochrome P450 [Mycena rosella]KAJ7661014.1 cytochrome P450 [Mycena rosella]
MLSPSDFDISRFDISSLDIPAQLALLKPVEISIPVVAACLLAWVWLRPRGKKIPGPKGWPIIGNLFDWPSEYQAETMAGWQKLYGPLTQLSVLGKDVLFLTSPRAISELFAKRASTFSDRPKLVFSEQMCGMNVLHPMTNFGEDFKNQRKFMKEVLAAEHLRNHEALLDEEGRRMLQSIFQTPNDCDRHLRRFSSSFSLRMVYGFEAMEIDDPHVLLAEEMMQLAEYAVIGGWIVDFIPPLKNLPAWFPGAGFQKTAVYYRAKILEMITHPWEEVRSKIAAGTMKSESFASLNMKKYEDGKHPYTETLIKATATAMYGGASDTTASAAWSFMLAMVLHPEVQAKAQAEIDSVTGGQRLPRMSDRASMPYLDKIVWEVFRWAPPVPVTLPHRNRVQDDFDGFVIPKDTTMVASLFSITRDEEFHNDPEEFNPDRYEDDTERIPWYVFGYGHRRCPGADMAQAQLFHQAAYILSSFTLTPLNDKDGNPIYPEAKFAGKMVRHPEPFGYNIKPRWAGIETLFQD